MPWTETSPGRFERPFSSLEDAHRALGAEGAPLGREHYSVSSTATFRIKQSAQEDATSILQDAWKAMRYRHPTIAAFPQDERYVYETPNPAAVESWLKETFIVVSSPTSVDGLHATFKPGKLAKLYYLPSYSEIMIHSSHWRIDGIGIIQLLNHVFEFVANPHPVIFGDESKNLSPGLDEVLGIPEPWTEEAGKAGQIALMDLLNGLPTIGMKTKPEQIPGATRRRRMTLSIKETSAIIAGCKSKGFSVTSGVHAAVVRVTQKQCDPAIPATRYTGLLPWDFRKYCPPPYNGADHAVTSYHSGFWGTIQPGSFLENAAQWKQIYARDPTSKEWRVFDWHAAYVRFGTKLTTSPRPEGYIMPTEPDISSLGDIDQYVRGSYGDNVKIEDVWLGVETLMRSIMTHVWTRQGRLNFSACFNENFYDADFVAKYLEDVKDELLEGLEVRS